MSLLTPGVQGVNSNTSMCVSINRPVTVSQLSSALADCALNDKSSSSGGKVENVSKITDTTQTPLAASSSLALFKLIADESKERIQQNVALQQTIQSLLTEIRGVKNSPEGATEEQLNESEQLNIANDCKISKNKSTVPKHKSGTGFRTPKPLSVEINAADSPPDSPSEPSESSSDDFSEPKKNKTKKETKQKVKKNTCDKRYDPAPMPKVEAKTLQPFSGSLDPLGPVQFIRELKLIKVSRGLDDKFFIRKWVPPFLSSDALEWFTDSVETFTSWDIFQKQFLARFKSKNHNPNIMEQLMALKQGPDSYLSYHKRCLKLERQLDNTVDIYSRISAFRHGTNKNLFEKLSMFEYDTLEQLRDKAIAIETADLSQKARIR